MITWNYILIVNIPSFFLINGLELLEVLFLSCLLFLFPPFFLGPDGFVSSGNGGTWASPVTPMSDFPVRALFCVVIQGCLVDKEV